MITHLWCSQQWPDLLSPKRETVTVSILTTLLRYPIKYHVVSLGFENTIITLLFAFYLLFITRCNLAAALLENNTALSLLKQTGHKTNASL